MLAEVGDRRIQQQLFDTSKRLETDPEKQGKPLREGLVGFRSHRVVGQRHRLIYSIDPQKRSVHVVAAGLRREGSRDDVYELAQKLVRLGLAPPAKPRKVARGTGSRKKK
jgi:mRNA interferase RelE/StbE